MHHTTENWLNNNNFVRLEDNPGLTESTKKYLSEFLYGHYKSCFFYVSVIERNIEFEEKDLQIFNHTISYAYIAVASDAQDELIDMFMVNLRPNIVRFPLDADETGDIVGNFFELTRDYYERVETDIKAWRI